MTIPNKSHPNTPTNSHDLFRVTKHTQTSFWKGKSVVIYDNRELGEISGLSFKKNSRIARCIVKILDFLLKKTHSGVEFEGTQLYIKTTTIKKLVASNIFKLFEAISHSDLSKEVSVEEIATVTTTYNAFLEKAQKASEQLSIEKLSIGNRKITLMAIRNEGGEVNIYAKPSSKNKNYQILGEGGFKTVVKAANLTQNRLVAIAKPNKKQKKKNDAVSDAEKEYGITKKLGESGVPHTMKAHDFVVIKRNHKDKYILVTDLASKGSLTKNLNRTKKDAHLRTKWALQICQTVQDMHEKGKMLHLDIKPDNILINEHDDVVIADFGLSGKVDDRNDITARGTPKYLAPEIIEGNKKWKWSPNRSYDAWAVGIVLYELKFGAINANSIPYNFLHQKGDYETIQKSINRMIKEKIHSQLQKTDPYDNILLGLLDPDPDKRLTLQSAVEQLKAFT